MKLNFSPTILRVVGIPIRIHWSFFAFLVWIIFSDEQGLTDGLTESLFFISVFLCVLLHELGHALTAKYFGIGTRDITLYPIGGVALLNGEAPPKQEFFIAIAGPLVNVAIAFLVLPFLTQLEGEYALISTFNIPLSFYDRFFLVNVVLVIFNMIPAFPMDGGRVVRSILSMVFSHDTATIFSARLGQLCSLIMLAAALYFGQIILLIISVFIFSLASKEIKFLKYRKSIYADDAIQDKL